MHVPWSRYGLSLFLGTFAAIGAGTTSLYAAGWPQAMFAWQVGFSLLLIYGLTALIIWPLQRRSSRFSVLVKAMTLFAATGTLFALGLPTFFVVPIWTLSGAFMATVWFAACLLNAYFAHHVYINQWAKRGEMLKKKSIKGSKIELNKFTRLLRFDPPSVIYFKPVAFNVALGVFLILSMLIGLNLRKVFPVFSAFAWGIPALFAASWIVQPLILAFHQIRAISALEKECGVLLVASDTE